MSTANARPVEPGSTIDFGRCLSFVFEDPRWVQKILIGSLFAVASMFIVGMFFLFGHSLELLRRVARREPSPLPEWDRLGEMFVEGLVAFFLYSVHALVATAVLMVPMFPLIVLSESGGEPPAVVGLGFFVFSLLGLAVMLAILVYVPAAIARYAVTRRVGAAFEVAENLDFIRRNLKNYVLALLVMMIGQFVAQFGILLLCVGIFPASVWAAWVFAYALGEVVLRDPGKGARGALPAGAPTPAGS